jgi:alpha-beta hydrolase superfamily lysophospholipase
MKLVFQDQLFSFQLLRGLGHTIYGGADIGECLSTAYRITEGDFESWYTEWSRTADRVRTQADHSLAHGHIVSAREAFLRASNYYRMAEFFLRVEPDDPRMMTTWGNSQTCFSQAATLFSPPLEAVEIPYHDTTLPGYFYRGDESSSPRATLLLQGGFDSTIEELHFWGAAAAMQRGYHCLIFEGPGQGRVRRQQALPFRPDWEHVVTPVIDFALTKPEIDSHRLALMGVSFGGHLAARAAALESRIAACILHSGLFDAYATTTARLPEEVRTLLATSDAPQVDSRLYALAQQQLGMRWHLTHGMWAYNAASPGAFYRMMQAYTLQGIAHQITCPTLVLDGERDHLLSASQQTRILYEALTCPKRYLLFTTDEGAEEHCQVGALALCHQRLFDWLDETFA